MSWLHLATLTTDLEWQFSPSDTFELCRIKVISEPVWGRGLIGQASATEPRDFYQIRGFYGRESEIIQVHPPDSFEELQAIAIKQYQGNSWEVSIEIWR